MAEYQASFFRKMIFLDRLPVPEKVAMPGKAFDGAATRLR